MAIHTPNAEISQVLQVHNEGDVDPTKYFELNNI